MGFFKEGINEKIVFSIVLLIIVAVIFVITGKTGKTAIQPQADSTTGQSVAAVAGTPAEGGSMADLEKKMEEKIAANLREIKGVGETKVLITYSSGIKKDYARDESTTKKTSKETDKDGGVRDTTEVTETKQVVIVGNTAPLVLFEERPEVAGVLIIAQGANDPKVKEQIFEAVKTLLNIQPAKISVAPLGGV